MRALATTVVALACAVFAAPAVVQSPVQPYGTTDAGGFLNALPPGENPWSTRRSLLSTRRPKRCLRISMISSICTPTSVRVAEADSGGGSELLQGRHLRRAARRRRVDREPARGRYDRARRELRGAAYLRHHPRGVMFGAGYAGAEDRLFLMDVLRHAGRPVLPSFAGGSPGNREMDRAQWAIAAYTAADLQSQLDNAPRPYGATGAQLVDDVDNYVAGINAYMTKALADPLLMPAEYAGGRQAPDVLDPDRHDRRGVADRRDLRQGRWQRAALGDDA